MKIFKIATIFSLLIITMFLSGCVLKKSQTDNKQTKIISAEETSLLTQSFIKEKSYDKLWEYMNPDDQKRWSGKEEYADMLSRVYSSSPIDSYSIKSTSTIPVWTHALTHQEYNDTKKVTLDVKNIDGTNYDSESILKLIDGKWLFFSTIPSKQDGENLKNSQPQIINYKELNKDPAKYIGSKVKFTGQVSQIQESNGIGFLLFNVTKGSYDFWDDPIWVDYYQSSNAVKDDIITVYGLITGAKTYQSVAGWNITVPNIEAFAIESPKSLAPAKDTTKQSVPSSPKIQQSESNKPVVVNKTEPVEEKEPLKIEGLAAIRIHGGIWGNWDADIEEDGPVIEIVYLDNSGNIISDDTTKTLPITATVKVYSNKYSGYKLIKDKLVYSATYSSSQMILGWIYPKIRIPKESLSVDAYSDEKYGTVEVTITTPEQGNFSASSDFIVLYE